MSESKQSVTARKYSVCIMTLEMKLLFDMEQLSLKSQYLKMAPAPIKFVTAHSLYL